MAFGPAFLPRRRVVWLALAGLILFAVVLLQLPLAGWVAGLEGRSAAVQALTSAKKWLALGAGLLGASVLAWAIRKRQFAVIWTGAMMGAARNTAAKLNCMPTNAPATVGSIDSASSQ